MTEKYDLRPVATSNLSDSFGGNSLASQWPLYSIPKNRFVYKLYFYLLSLSAFDHSQLHAYISDRFWQKKTAAEAIGCTPRTVTNNLATLERVGLLYRDDIHKAYVFNSPLYQANIPHQIIKLVLSLDGQLDAIEALRIFSIIQYAHTRNVNSFCVTDIKMALGNPNANGDFIRLCLGWWESIGLIQYTTTSVGNGYCVYTKYTIKKIFFEPSNIDENDGPLTPDFQELFKSVHS